MKEEVEQIKNKHTKDTIMLFRGSALAMPRKAEMLEARRAWTPLLEMLQTPRQEGLAGRRSGASDGPQA